MRLWTIHPQYLDTKGLLAVWREGLLAQQVLLNKTVGYRNHPQLKRFIALPDTVGAIATYLRGIFQEAVNRGYRFGGDKIYPAEFHGQIVCTRGQLLYEWNHLREKLRQRDESKYQAIEIVNEPKPHPLFYIIDGDVEDWEIRTAKIGT
jgi:hypothetical protein